MNVWDAKENPDPVFVCFTCKSRFCHKCGKNYTGDWSDKQQEMIFNIHQIEVLNKMCISHKLVETLFK